MDLEPSRIIRKALSTTSLHYLLDVLQQLSGARHLPDLLAIVRKAARELTACDGATLVLRDGAYCHYVEENAMAPLWKGQRFPMDDCIAGWAMLHRQPAVVPDIREDPRLPHEHYVTTFVKSLVMVPIRHHDPVGAIGNYWSQAHIATAEEIGLLQALADATAVAIENIRLYASLEQRIDERTAELARSLAAEREALARAEAAQHAAELADRAKSEFLAIMSHEVRTPLNGLMGLTALVLDSPLDEEQHRLLTLARQSGDLLLSLINDYLDFARIEAGKLELDPVTFDLHALVAEVSALFHGSLQSKGLAFESRVDAPVRVQGDPARLRQVLMNLLGNAIKFTRQGRIRLRCHEVREDAPGIWLCFAVDDTGIGIDRLSIERIFEPFTQADSSTTRRFGGTGLGLAICKALVELMGGQIGAEGEPGKGSTFWALVPMQQPAEADADAAAAPTSTGASADGRVNGRADAPASTPHPLQGRVLLVEDNAVNQFMTAETLRRMGLEVDIASNGAEAVGAVRKEPYDLVLMDCDMPVIDGFEATRTIRALEGGRRHVPILALTASVLFGGRRKCLEAGMDDYLAKPVRPEALRERVSAWLRLQRCPADRAQAISRKDCR